MDNPNQQEPDVLNQLANPVNEQLEEFMRAIERVRNLDNALRDAIMEVDHHAAVARELGLDPNEIMDADEGIDDFEPGEDEPLNIVGMERGAGEGIEDLPDRVAALLHHVIGPDPPAEPAIGPVPPRQLQRGPREPYRITARMHQSNWYEKSMGFNNKWFRRVYRMSKATFWVLIAKLAGNPLFQTRGGRPQRPVHYQFAVFLLRYGSRGSGAFGPAVMTGVGEGTVFLYCRRVIRALRELGLTCVGWPNAARKEEIKDAFYERMGLDGIIGAVDGSLIPLARQPSIGGPAYFCRKGYPAVNIQATVDHECRFTSFEGGWPGSKNDKFIWIRSWVWGHRNQLFAEREFILGDAGYPTTRFLLRPYAQNEMVVDRARKRQFNGLLSRSRVLVECAFGRLKARFPALTMMGQVHDIQDLYRAVGALLVLHNLCYDYHDTTDGLPDEFTQAILDRIEQREQGVEVDDDEPNLMDVVGQIPPGGFDQDPLPQEDVNLYQEGLAFRDECLDILVPHQME